MIIYVVSVSDHIDLLRSLKKIPLLPDALRSWRLIQHISLNEQEHVGTYFLNPHNIYKSPLNTNS